MSAEEETARYRALLARMTKLASDLEQFADSGEVAHGIGMGWRGGMRIAAHNLRTALDEQAAP